MIERSKLFVYTFLAVFLSIVVVGAVVVPILFNTLERNYYGVQADVNSRQAKSMARFIRNRLEQGINQETVIREFQAAIVGTELDKGYVCLVDQVSSDYLCHPMTTAVGMSISLKQALYDHDFDGQNLIKWEEEIMAGKSGSGLLHYPENPSEIVYFHSIEEMNWTISSHENSERIEKEISDIKNTMIFGSIIFGLALAFPISVAVRRVSRRYEQQLEAEQHKSDKLLLNILPGTIASRMKNGEKNIVDHFSQVSLMFCDIAGFTKIAAQISPQELVKLLNKTFSHFEEICQKHQVEKIKTIGDEFLAVSGAPEKDPMHARRIAEAALEISKSVNAIDPGLSLRIGIHTGEVVAGVIGSSKFSYDLWGDTVNIASRLQSNGVVGGILCSKEFRDLLQDDYRFEFFGRLNLKGKGEVDCYLLYGS